MDSKHYKTGAKKLTRSNAVKRKSLHLRYIPLKGRKKSRSEPTLSKSGENTVYHNSTKVKESSVIANHQHVENHPQLLLKYPGGIKKSSNVAKNTIEIKHVSNIRKVQNPINKLKTNDKLKKIITKQITTRASMKTKKIAPCTKKGGFTEKIVSMWHYAKSFLGLSNSDQQNTPHCVQKPKSQHNLPVKPKRAIYVVKKPSIHRNYKDMKDFKNKPKPVLKDQPNKDIAIKLINIQPFQCENKVNVKANEKELIKEQIVLADKSKKDTTIEISTNQIQTLYNNKNRANVKTNEIEKIKAAKQTALNNKPKGDIQTVTNTNQSIQQENQSKVNIKAIEKEQIEADKQMVLKDKKMKGITLEINTNRVLPESLAKTNYYKVDTLEGTNTTIIIEIKNTSNNIPQDNKQLQPQSLIVNCATETKDFHNNTKECDENLLTLLNTSKVKQNNNARIITSGRAKIPVKKLKKPLSKVLKQQYNLNKKKQPLVKEHKKYRKVRRQENIKRCVRHERYTSSMLHYHQRSCKYHHHNTEYRHKHNCRYHEIKHIKQRSCSICKGYISTDYPQQEKVRHSHHKAEYEYKEPCHVCKRLVSCLYHHNKKYHKHNRNDQEEKNIRQKHRKESKSLKKNPTPKNNKSFHNFQKKKRTLTVCTNSRRNSFKSKKQKRSVTYIPAQIKSSTSKILPKIENSKSNSSILGTGCDSDSDRREATKVLSWCYLHYALNAVQRNSNDKILTQSDDTEENYSFQMPYEEFCNMYEAVSNDCIDSDDSSDDNWNENFDATTNFPRHPNSFTEDEIISENIYQGKTTNTPQKSTIDLQTEQDN